MQIVFSDEFFVRLNAIARHTDDIVAQLIKLIDTSGKFCRLRGAAWGIVFWIKI